MDDFIINCRTYLHRYPEIGFNTYQTAKFIYKTLAKLGYNPNYALDKNAVYAYLDLGKEKTLCFRSDMDALNVKEETNVPFKSKNEYMHACGHDAHMTILLYAAKLIINNLDKLKYNLVILFQPAEEGPLPGGAYYLKDIPILKKVNEFYAFHVSPTLEVGKIGIKIGEACAAPDLWELELTGLGCHASRPENGRNPILGGAEIVLQFERFYQDIKQSKNIVLSTTYFNSGVSMNIIKDKAYLKGTARSFNEMDRKYLATEMENIISKCCNLYKLDYKFDFHYAYPPLFNDKDLAAKMFTAASYILGAGNCISLANFEMIGEDFAYYNEIAPICLTWIGAKNIGAEFYDLHNAKFIVPFETIEYGGKILFELVTKTG